MLLYYTITAILIILVVIILLIQRRNEHFGSDWFHRSTLASTFWMTQPQVQHTFPDLGLQNPDHYDYFENACEEKEPNNAELCRYHKHRFDPSQL